MNIQVIAGPDGRIVWVSGPLPGAVHDLKAARIWGIVRELGTSGMLVLADKGYIGAGPHIQPPTRARTSPNPKRPPTGPTPNSEARGTGERTAEELEDPDQASLLPHRAGHLAKAIHTLQNREVCARWKMFTIDPTCSRPPATHT
jgi:hypothetical protein